MCTMPRYRSALWVALLGSSLLAATPPPADEARFREAARLRGLALADFSEGQFERAAGLFRELAALLPDNVLPALNLALCELAQDRPEAALREAQRARDLAPDNPQVLYALARIYEALPEREAEWRMVLEHFARVRPADPRPHALLAGAAQREGRAADAVAALQRALAAAPENLVVMLDLLVAAADAGDTATLEDALNALEDRLDGFEGHGPPGQLTRLAGELRRIRTEPDLAPLRPRAQMVRNLLRPADLYQQGLRALGGGVPPEGYFPQLDFEPPLPKSIEGGLDLELAWAEAVIPGAADLGPLDTLRAARQLEPERGQDAALVVAAGKVSTVRAATGGPQLTASALTLPAGTPGLVADLDGDGQVDLAHAAADGALVLAAGQGGSWLAERRVLMPAAGPVTALHPLDVDHDGDLDLLLTAPGQRDRYVQNPGPGAWLPGAADAGLAGEGSRDLAVADFDDDGDLDVLRLGADGVPRLLSNRRTGSFDDVSSAWGVPAAAGFRHARAADFDLDGKFDVLLAGPSGATVLRNAGGRFESRPLAPGAWVAAEVADVDNDGDPDVLAASGDAATGLVLLRNRREQGFRAEPLGLPLAVGAAGPREVTLLPGDFDNDGDLDLLFTDGAGSLRLARNDGGNQNHWLRLTLRGKTEGNAKNNSMALFARIEVSSGGAYAAAVGNGGANHLGLGTRREAEVVRVLWTNGLAQTWQRVAVDQTLVEEQVLKGSCPFLYTWNGREFEFHTDLLWRSPLGMILPDGRPAPHQSARDFVLIPGERLQPAGDELWLAVTEELWETAYVDELSLLAVDHPPGAELVVDEKFYPPPYAPEPALHWLTERVLPAAARDQAGRDQNAAIAARDGWYVGNLPLGRHQGTTRGHHLDLTFPEVPGDSGRLLLVLWGWIFPTDTSINYALSQDPAQAPAPPRLELVRADGSTRLLNPFLGFPNGKRKALVTDVTGLLPAAGPVTLRIAGSMQIYWDHAVLARDASPDGPRFTRLRPTAADLHYRGYSRLYRESTEGPHLFDYRQVSVGPRFRDQRGAFTRFGDVTPLLAAAESQSVVMNAGDEMLVRFDATRLPPLPAGWRRDYVLATDGWVKDADFHTAASATVEPLPHHGQTRYPDPDHPYPDGPAYREYRTTYQTRQVGEEPFRDALRPPG